MSASNEWETKYLTTSGWVAGGCRYDHGESKEDIKPEGAVLRAKRHVTVGKIGASGSVDVDESKDALVQDKDLIIDLLYKHGQPQFGV